MTKESSKRGYMNKGEIEEHLKKLKTNEGRIGYLTKVIAYNEMKGRKLLAPQTVQYAREIRQELYEKREPHLSRTLELSSSYDNLTGDEPKGRVVLPGELEKHKRKKGKDLGDKLMSIIAIVGLGAGIFFLSPIITGNVIGSLNQNNSNIIGAVLLAVGLIGVYMWRKNSHTKKRGKSKKIA